jgi:ribosome maturation factor RimP
MNHTDEQEIKAGVDLTRIRATVAPVLHAQGVVLADLEWLTDRAGWVLRISIEREGTTDLRTGSDGGYPHAPGGVTLEDCVEVSRGVSAVLDADDFIPHHYHLEVSSPGVDRPLRTEADIVRFVGQTAKVKLRSPAPDGQRVLRGVLDAAPAGNVAVIVDGKRIEVPYADVAEANLVFELAAQPKKKTAPAKSSNRGAKKSPRRSASMMGAPAPKPPARSS